MNNFKTLTDNAKMINGVAVCRWMYQFIYYGKIIKETILKKFSWQYLIGSVKIVWHEIIKNVTVYVLAITLTK